MTPQSAKQKGRHLQQRLRNDLREIGKNYSLQDDDVESRGMGQNGEDIILTPAAREIFDLIIEAKNVESLNVTSTFIKHYEKYKNKSGLVLLAHKRNRTEPLVTLRWEDFLLVLKKVLPFPGVKVGETKRQT